MQAAAIVNRAPAALCRAGILPAMTFTSGFSIQTPTHGHPTFVFYLPLTTFNTIRKG